jgi:hypothetical protein
MAGKYLVVLGTLVVVGFASAACWLQEPPYSAATTFRHVPVGPASPADVVPIASGLGLHWLGSPAGSRPDNNVLVSLEPLTSERLDHLNMHHPDFERWRGIVTIIPRGWQVLRSNYDPAHPERFAVWGDLFLFGDPEVIAKLLPEDG